MSYLTASEQKQGEYNSKKLMRRFREIGESYFPFAYPTLRYGEWIVKLPDGYWPFRIWPYWAASNTYRLSGRAQGPWDCMKGSSPLKGYYRDEIKQNPSKTGRDHLELTFNLASAEKVLTWACANMIEMHEIPDWLEPLPWLPQRIRRPLDDYLWERDAKLRYKANYEERKAKSDARRAEYRQRLARVVTDLAEPTLG